VIIEKNMFRFILGKTAYLIWAVFLVSLLLFLPKEETMERRYATFL
jgi:hypothetical protein